MENNVLVSVCIPVYNCERFISSTIQSVLNQTYQNFELIVVDNCSTDNTICEIQKFKSDKLFLLQNDTNLGIEYNWNKALELAKGEYIKLLPADDILNLECLSKQVQVLNDQKDVVMVGCNRDIINAEGNKIFGFKKSYTNKKLSRKEIFFYSVELGTNPIGEPGSILIRKKFLKSSKNFDNSFPYVIDLYFYLNYLEYGKCFLLDDFLYSFRISSNSLSVNIAFKQSLDFIKFIKHYVIFNAPKYNLDLLRKVKMRFSTFVKMVLRMIIYRVVKK